MGFCSKGLENEFETAVVNEPSVFEPLKFYCISERSASTIDAEDSGVNEINNICPPKYTLNSENQQTYTNQLRLNLERISNDFHNSIANNNFQLPLQLVLEAVYNAAEIMKKRVSNRKPDNNCTRRNKSWFDLHGKTLRKNSIRALTVWLTWSRKCDNISQ